MMFLNVRIEITVYQLVQWRMFLVEIFRKPRKFDFDVPQASKFIRMSWVIVATRRLERRKTPRTKIACLVIHAFFHRSVFNRHMRHVTATFINGDFLSGRPSLFLCRFDWFSQCFASVACDYRLYGEISFLNVHIV